MLKRHYRMTGAVTLFGTVAVGILAGAILALSLLKGNSVRAIVDLDRNTGRTTYALETAVQATTSGTHLVATVPAVGQTGAGRLTARAKLGLNVAAGQTATVRYEFDNMVLHGATSPTLTVEASTSPAAAAYTGATITGGDGMAGDTSVTFTLDGSQGGTNGFSRERSLRLRIESVAVEPRATGTITMTVSKTVNGNERTYDAKADAVGSANVLRESASPVSPAAVLTTGFRLFAMSDFVRRDRLAASVGSLSFGLTDTSYYPFQASGTSTPIAALSEVIQPSSSVSFAGDFSFADDVYLSTDADCSSTGDDRTAVSGTGDSTRTSTVANVNGKHLCIEVDGVTPIRGTQPYRATVAYTGSVTGLLSAFAPGNAELTLGRILSGSASVSIPYMSTHQSTNHRLFMFNRLNRDVDYRIVFEPPSGVTARPMGPYRGTLPPGGTSLRIRDLVELSRGSRTALTLHVDAPPESLDVLTIRFNLGDNSTDTVRYEPEAR